jgi:hypothetical protein
MQFNLSRFSSHTVFTVILALAFSSCHQDDQLEVIPSSDNSLTYTGTSPETTLTGQFAIQFAEAMELPEVRTFVKSKVMLQFDGDFDFLLAFEKDSKISIDSRPEVSVFGELFSFPNHGGAQNKSVSNDFIDALLAEEPLIQIHIPELWEGSTADWDELQFIPKIACLSLVEVDKGDIPTLNPITQAWTELSGTVAPDEVTIVLSRNERIIHSVGPYVGKSGSLNKMFCPLEPIASEDDEFYYDYEDVEDFDNCNAINNGNGGDPPPTTVTFRSTEFPCEDSDRAQNDNRDQVSFRRFVDMDRWRDANEWFDGEHEIKVHITFRNTSGGPTTVNKSWFGRSDDLRTCTWFHCDIDHFNGEFKDIITWLPEVQGSLMNYTWEEVDDGPAINLAIKFKPTVKIFGVEVSIHEVSASISIQNRSDRLGEHLVEYCDRTTPPTEYSSDWVFFQVRQTVN